MLSSEVKIFLPTKATYFTLSLSKRKGLNAI